MLSDRDALLAAIRANPDEDTPRLVFADWLEESGDAHRAEFVRVQCELARLAADRSDSRPVYDFLRDRDWVTRPAADWSEIDDGIHRRIALTMRADDLLARHGGAWLPKLPKKCKVHWDGFHRGFPHRVALHNVHKMGASAERLRAAVPAVTLVSDEFTPAFVEQLAAAGLLGWVVGLELTNDCAAGLRELGHRPEAGNVRTLSVRSESDVVRVAAALADGPHWTGLRTLDLADARSLGTTADALFGAKHLRTLTRLHLRGFDNESAGAVRALAAGRFTELDSLHLTYCELDDDAAEALAACPALANLRELDLGHNRIGGRGLTALLASPHLANVAFLGLEGNPLHGVDADRLAALAPAGLRMLHAHGARLRTADVRALARCPRLRTLWYLDLDANNLTTAAVRELARGFKDVCPPILWLTRNRIDDRGAEVLAKWKAAAALRVLHLRYNYSMTDAGARALLDSPHLSNLTGLGVSAASEETDARLSARFKHYNDSY